MTELETQLLRALEALSQQYATEQQRLSEQIATLAQQVEQLATQVNKLTQRLQALSVRQAAQEQVRQREREQDQGAELDLGADDTGRAQGRGGRYGRDASRRAAGSRRRPSLGVQPANAAASSPGKAWPR